MKNKAPHIITEGNSQYELGKYIGSEINYDFKKILIYLDHKGKLLFGKHFKIHKENHTILLKLCTYFIKDHDGCEKLGLDLQKGILLSGPVGCGKTSLMKLLPHFIPYLKRYEIIPARNVTFQFNRQGFNAIEQYGSSGFYCFDDLGVEPSGRYFGKDCNVMGEVILSRYDLYCHSRHCQETKLSFGSKVASETRRRISSNHKPILTHATTNLNAQELEDRYGERVRSRMRQMFNLISFDSNSKDKRC